MPPFQVPIDGLWRCLCPSIDAFILSYRGTPVHSVGLSLVRSSRKSRNVSNPPFRAFHSSSHRAWQNLPGQAKTQGLDAFHKSDSNISQPQNVKHHAKKSWRPGMGEEGAKQKQSSKYEMSSPDMHAYDKLRALRGKEGSYQEILDLVEYLVLEKGEKPTLIHYESLIIANSDAEHGSVEAVKFLLEEMKEYGINGNSGLYHYVLQVLAVHPDYLLRNDILQEMKERWLGLSPDGWHSLVIGLLRDRQIEVAIDKLEQMQADRVPVQPWLYDIVMYKLCEFGELDQAYQLLIHRFQYDRKRISQAIWYFLLDTFSRAFHYDGTNYIWKFRVIHNYLNPSDGICANVLNLAARHGDGTLATSATRILSSRRTALTPLHYEALLASYTGAGDMHTAFRVLGIMTTAGFEPDSGTTRPLFSHLTSADGRPHSAWEILRTHFEDGHLIPTAAINVIIEAYIRLENFEQAINVYKELHTVCETGPNIETINVLLQGAERRKAKETAMFLASEMVALGIKPNLLTYDRLIMVCLHEQDYEDAFNYLEEMVEVGKNQYQDTGRKGWWMRKGTAFAMIQKCAASSSDPRGISILEEAVQRGVLDHEYANQLYRNLYGGVRLNIQNPIEGLPEKHSEFDSGHTCESGLTAWSTS